MDHNLCTLDGQGTYHGMGLVVAVTPGVMDTNIMGHSQINETFHRDHFRRMKVFVKGHAVLFSSKARSMV